MNSRLGFIVGVVSFLVAGLTSSFGQQLAAQGQGFWQSAALTFNVGSTTGGPGQTIPMNISLTGAAENLRAIVMIRGIPRQFRLSCGFLNGNAWLVPLSELEGLRLVVPDDFGGRFEIEVTFLMMESKLRQTRYASVIIQPERQPEDRLSALEGGKPIQPRFASVFGLLERQPKDPLFASEESKPIQAHSAAAVVVLPDRQPKDPLFAPEEGKPAQARSAAAVAVLPERRPKDRFSILEEGKQTQTRSAAAVAVLPERRPKDRLEPVSSSKALTQVKLAALPPLPPEREKSMMNTAVAYPSTPAVAIICEGEAQVQRDGRRIFTPYCQDGHLAAVAQSYGIRTSAYEMRYNLSEKARVCRFIGDDNRARTACASYRNEVHRK